MSGNVAIREGMEVYGGNQLLGRVEGLRDDGFEMNGLYYTQEMIGRVEGDRVFLGDSGTGPASAALRPGDQAAHPA